MSADYVALLNRHHGSSGYEFVNAGINGSLAWNVLQRVDEVIKYEPDVVTLLIGTNDVNSENASGRALAFLRLRKIRQVPDLRWYADSVDEILSRIQSETTANIAVLDLPMLGEELSSEINDRVRAYCAALRDVAARHHVPVLPLYERLAALIPPTHRPPAFRRADIGLMLKGAFSHRWLRRSFDEISRRNGFLVTTDHIHLNDTAGAIAADLIWEYLTDPAIPA
jgi:lysophospholipase L1-like esterase